MKYLLGLSILLFSIINFSANAQTKIAKDAELKKVLASFKKLKKENPGVSVSILKDNKYFTDSKGSANLEWNAPLSDSVAFNIGSTSKQFTAVCILLLEQDGKLNVNDPIGKYFPELPAYKDSVTIWHLLHHTSGVVDYLQLSYLIGKHPNITDKDILHWLSVMENLNFPMGTKMSYSNSNFWLLEQLIKRVSGKGITEFAKERIFTPLKMNQTQHLKEPAKIVKNRVSGYTINDKEQLIRAVHNSEVLGGGGLVSTTKDMNKWINECLTQKHLGKKIWKKMRTTFTLKNGKQSRTACGLFIVKSDSSFKHGGNDSGFETAFQIWPEHSLGIVVSANAEDLPVRSIMKKYKDVFIPKPLSKKSSSKKTIDTNTVTTQPSKDSLKMLVGLYRMSGVDFEVSLKEDSLNIKQLWNDSEYKVYRKSENDYIISPKVPITFTFANYKNSKAQEVSIMQGGTKSDALRVNRNAPKIDKESFVGIYRNEVLDINYDINLRNDSLFCTITDKLEFPLSGGERDIFSVGFSFEFIFSRKNKQPDSFILNAGRVDGIRFKKIK